MSKDKQLPQDYLEYPLRRRGMDHDRYAWSMLCDRPKIHWPDNKTLALWITVPIQFFPLNQKGDPFKVPGGMTMPYPDLRHYSLRDYGNRVGIYRLLNAFDKYNIKPTFAINSQAAERMPYLMERINERRDDIICHGLNMDAINHSGLSKQEEKLQIQQALEQLRGLTSLPIHGWLSPAKNESINTLDILSEEDILFVCDWVNDELPYYLNAGDKTTSKQSLISMPLSTELEDYFIIQQNFHSEESWHQQICDACDFLITEASTQGGRMLSLTIHPWLMGQPHRITYLEQTLEYLANKKEIWHAGASQISSYWQKHNQLK